MTEDEWHFIVDINLTEAFQGAGRWARTCWRAARARW